MSKDVLVNAGAGELRVAVVEDGRLEQIWCERTIGLGEPELRRSGTSGPGRSLVGDIILGRVQRVLPAMQAAFVTIGLERAGFLAAREARPRTAIFRDEPYTEEERNLKIADYAREGEDILVQIVKDPINDKGARLSANVTIPGRYLILVANSPGVALSRRIEDEAERARLTAIAEGFARLGPEAISKTTGYILRTAAIGASPAELEKEAVRLNALWSEIAAARATASIPSTLYSDLGPVERALRDEVDDSVGRILIDDSAAFAAARNYATHAMAGMAAKIEAYAGPQPLFEHFGIEDGIEALSNPRVPLPSGGWITIEATEALTAIDVNSGSYIASGGLEETSLKINLEAAQAVGRQLRLRGIGGLIVIDFIHLELKQNVAAVLAALEAACAKGREPVQILGMSEFGLVEMTRKRVREPLAKRLTEICRRCDGHGRRKTVESVAVEMMRQVERAASGAPGRPIILRAAPVMVRWLETHEGEIHAALSRRGVAQLRIETGSEQRREIFDVRAG
jgi:ribonuclease G